MKKWIWVVLVAILAFFPAFSPSTAWARTKHTAESRKKGKKGHKGKKSKNGKSQSDKASAGTIGKSDVEFDTKSSK